MLQFILFSNTFSDKTNKPKVIIKYFQLKGSIGSDSHENWTLLRLLLLKIGDKIPEN